jgi:hypothetical protein
MGCYIGEPAQFKYEWEEIWEERMADSPKQTLPPIWETLRKISESVPKEEWEKMMPRPAEWAEHELVQLQAELRVLKEDLHYAIGTCELAMKHRDEAEAEVRRLKEQQAMTQHVAHRHSDEVHELRAEIERLKQERINCPPVSESEYVKRLENENFALAANQCHDGYAGEYGHHMCREVEELKEEIEYWKDFVPETIKVNFPFKVRDEKTQTEQDR